MSAFPASILAVMPGAGRARPTVDQQGDGHADAQRTAGAAGSPLPARTADRVVRPVPNIGGLTRGDCERLADYLIRAAEHRRANAARPAARYWWTERDDS